MVLVAGSGVFIVSNFNVISGSVSLLGGIYISYFKYSSSLSLKIYAKWSLPSELLLEEHVY